MLGSRESSTDNETRRSWLWRLAIALTVVWLFGGVTYILFLGGLDALAKSGADGVGGFLEGFFAPLAFLWLVIGLFIQQQELASNTEALQRTNRISEQQTKVLEATELRARQSSFFQIADNVRKQTGNLVGILLRDLVKPDGTPVIPIEEMNGYWIEHQQDQSEIFPGLLSTDQRIVEAGLTYKDVFYRTAETRAYTAEYVRGFRGLIELAKGCDSDGTILRTVTQTPHGLVYGEILETLTSEVAWATFDRSVFMVLPSELPEVTGTWDIAANSQLYEDGWRLEIQSHGEELDGQVCNSTNEIPLVGLATQGRGLFARFSIAGTNLVLTATIEGDQLEGYLDHREGIFTKIEAIRRSQAVA